MSNHYHALTVVLEEPLHEDHVEQLKKAIETMKGVHSVTGEVADISHYTARATARTDIAAKLYQALRDA